MHDRPLYAPLTQTRELYLRKQFCCSHARILSSRRGGFQYFALKAGRQHLDDRGGVIAGNRFNDLARRLQIALAMRG